MDFKSQVGIVTGGIRGIGKAIAAELAQRGVNLVAAARAREAVQDVAEALSTADVKVLGMKLDVSSAFQGGKRHFEMDRSTPTLHRGVQVCIIGTTKTRKVNVSSHLDHMPPPGTWMLPALLCIVASWGLVYSLYLFVRLVWECVR